ncbi:MAG: 50S ribosomal protein L33 [Proteobacteria bacterium]|nr:50S ribosomal protein L33 [Pseudomonadota bacterium]
MAKKKNVGRQNIILECVEQRAMLKEGQNFPGISRYSTQKNKRNTSSRIELKKYNRYLRKVTLHREIK